MRTRYIFTIVQREDCAIMEAFQDYVPAQERIDILNAAIERATEMKNDVIKNSTKKKITMSKEVMQLMNALRKSYQ